MNNDITVEMTILVFLLIVDLCIEIGYFWRKSSNKEELDIFRNYGAKVKYYEYINGDTIPSVFIPNYESFK